MAIDPALLDQALRTPESQDVTDTPIVRAVILTDPANAALLVPFLAQSQSQAGRNALRILCEFGPAAVPATVAALAAIDSPIARTTGLAALWAMFAGESLVVVREHLAASTAAITALLDDRSAVADEMPAHIERDFTGRVCDFTYVVINELQNPEFDQSTFRGMTNQERDQAITGLKARGFGGLIA